MLVLFMIRVYLFHAELERVLRIRKRTVKTYQPLAINLTNEIISNFI